LDDSVKIFYSIRIGWSHFPSLDPLRFRRDDAANESEQYWRRGPGRSPIRCDCKDTSDDSGRCDKTPRSVPKEVAERVSLPEPHPPWLLVIRILRLTVSRRRTGFIAIFDGRYAFGWLLNAMGLSSERSAPLGEKTIGFRLMNHRSPAPK